MDWYEVTFSVEDISARRARDLIEAFEHAYIASAGARDAALFKRRESAYVYYFSPGGARIATHLVAAYSGVACPAPMRSEVQLMAGDERLEEIPFADR